MIRMRYQLIFIIAIFLTIQIPGLFGMPNQTDSTTVFDGIDYYSGRMVSGIGFGFHQYIDEKKEGDQTFRSMPFLYYRWQPAVAFSLSNETSIRRVGTTNDIQYSNNPVGNRTHVRLQWRPLRALQMFPFIEFYNTRDTYDSHYSGDCHEQVKTRESAFGLTAHYLSGGGEIPGEPSRLKWMHFSDTSRVLLAPGQTMIGMQGIIRSHREENTARELNAGYNPQVSIADEAALFGQVRLQIDHGLFSGFWARCQIQADQEQTDEEEQEPDIESEASLYEVQWQIAPALIHYLHPDFLHEIAARFSTTALDHEKQTRHGASMQASQSRTLDVCYFSCEYQMHGLFGVDSPGRDQFLANYQGLFGNRLNAGGMGMTLKGRYSRERIHIPDPPAFNILLPTDLDTKILSRSAELTGQFRAGLFQWLEWRLRTGFWIQRISQPDPTQSTIGGSQEFDHRVWSNQTGLRFGNFIFDDGLQAKYEWHRLNRLDQRYGAMLSRGMIRGEMSAVHFIFRDIDPGYSILGANTFIRDRSSLLPAYVNNLEWEFHGRIEMGLPAGMMITGDADHFFYETDLRNPYDPEWRFQLQWIWQPWRTLRFSLSQISARAAQNVYTYPEQPPFDTYLTDTRTRHAWMFQISGLW